MKLISCRALAYSRAEVFDCLTESLCGSKSDIKDHRGTNAGEVAIVSKHV